MVVAWSASFNATFSLKHVVLWKLMYPLTTTTFSCQQCHQIMAPLLQENLAQAGIVWTYPWALVHGPLQYSGLETLHLYTKQILAHACTILQYGIDRSDPTGFLLHMALEAM